MMTQKEDATYSIIYMDDLFIYLTFYWLLYLKQNCV